MLEKISSLARKLRINRVTVAFFVLVAISAFVRISLALTSRARASWDTPGYVVTAQAIRNMDFSRYDGKRTPGYPLLLLLGGFDFGVVRQIQLLLGIAIACLMFVITWQRTRSAAASFMVGLLSSLAISELLFEQVIYSETLCTFWLVLSLFAFARTLAADKASIWNYVLLGLSAGLAGITRPMFLYLGPLYFVMVIAHRRKFEFRVLRDPRLLLVLAPTILFALGWSLVKAVTLNYFGVTTTTGYNLSNHSGAFMELAPPQYSEIAQIYLRYRPGQIQRIGNQSMTIWYAEREIQSTTGLNTAQLSQALTRMSLEMFAEHPLFYLGSVSDAWAKFWGSEFYHFIKFYRAWAGRQWYEMILLLGTFQLAVNVMFLLIAAFSIARLVLRRARFDFDFAVITIVLAGSVVQALMEYGENIRYLAPLVPLTIYTVVGFLRWPLRGS